MAKTNPSISISFPRKEKQDWLDKRDRMVALFTEQVKVSSFSEIIRMVLNGELKEVDGCLMWVAKIEV